MLVYEKYVDDTRHLFGTMKNVPADTDNQLVYKDAEGAEIEPVLADSYVDGGGYTIKRMSDGKQVDVYIDDVDEGLVNIIPGTGEVPPAPVELTGITVTHMPTQSEHYHVGDKFNYSGVEITATYSDESTQVVTDSCTFDPVDGTEATTVGETSVLVTYQEKTASFIMTVEEEKVLTDIALETTGAKMTYEVDEALTVENVIVKAQYSDRTEEDVTASSTFNPADGTIFEEAGEVTVTATYEGFSESYAVTVSANENVEVAKVQAKKTSKKKFTK